MSESQQGDDDVLDYDTILRSVDPSVPVPGEAADPSEASLEQAIAWTESYRELLALERKVLNAIKEQLPGLGEIARREAETTNIPLISGQLRRFEKRLEQWERRRRELEQTD
jgi:hypothetical protein